MFLDVVFGFYLFRCSYLLKGNKKLLGNGVMFGFIFLVENEDVVDFGIEVILEGIFVFWNLSFLFLFLFRDCFVVSF